MILTQLNLVINYGWHVSKAFIKFYICVCLNLSIRSEISVFKESDQEEFTSSLAWVHAYKLVDMVGSIIYIHNQNILNDKNPDCSARYIYFVRMLYQHPTP